MRRPLIRISLVLSGCEDWRADGHRWRQNGTSKLPKNAPVVRKIHFHIETSSGTSAKFRKFVYKVIGTEEYVVVQYLGDDGVQESFPHGRNCWCTTF